jgi:hypothetical protein
MKYIFVVLVHLILNICNVRSQSYCKGNENVDCICVNGKTCKCGIGMFADLTNGHYCENCPAGWANNQENSTTCSKCENNTYSLTNKTTCVNCPSGWISESGSFECSCTDATQCRCTAGMTNSSDGVCTNCQSGKYKGVDENNCENCPAGFYSMEKSLTCQGCPGGWVSEPGQACQECPRNTYSQGQTCHDCQIKDVKIIDSGACTDEYGWTGSCDSHPCNCSNPSRVFRSPPGSTRCGYCDGGKQFDGHGCSCPSGTFGDLCSSCPSGYKSPVINSVNCEQCAPGQYQAYINNAECNDCGAGFYSYLPAQTTCTECPVGYFQANEASAKCDKCEAGQYQIYTGRKKCQTCQSGKFGTDNGCEDCAIGKFFSEERYTSVVKSRCTSGFDRIYNVEKCREITLEERQGQELAIIQDSIEPAGCYFKDKWHFNSDGNSMCSAGGGTCKSNYGFPPEDWTVEPQPPPPTWTETIKDNPCFQDTDCHLRPSLIAGTCQTENNSAPQEYYNKKENTPCYEDSDCYLEDNAITSLFIAYSFKDSSCVFPTPNMTIGFNDARCVFKDVRCVCERIETCTLCPSGTFQDNTGSVICNACPQGWQSDTGAQVCEDCSIAAICCNGWERVNGTCAQCPVGQFSEDTVCKHCPSGYISLHDYMVVDGKVDEYTSVNGSVKCLGCIAGLYFHDNACDECPSGYYSSESQINCTACPAGYFSDNAASPECDECNSGFYMDEHASAIPCKYCAANTFSNVTNHMFCFDCPAGTKSPIGSEMCNDICPLNTIGNDCSYCEEGFQSSFYKEMNDGKCEGNWTYNSTENECHEIANAFGLTSTVLTTEDDQLPTGCIISGETLQLNKANTVVNCSVSNTCLCKRVTTLCVKCLDGYYKDDRNEDTCIKCPIGFVSIDNKRACQECTPGYEATPDQTDCVQCAVGQYNNVSVLCVDCPIGKYSDQAGQMGCTDCSGGTYSDNPGATTCLSCDGIGVSGVGAGTCVECPPFMGSSDGVTCSNCTKGQEVVSNKCVTCSLGKLSMSDSVGCEDCPPGRISTQLGECVDCESGFYSVNTTSCIACPGTFVPNRLYSGSSFCIECRGKQICQTCRPGQEINGTNCTNCTSGKFSAEGRVCSHCPLNKKPSANKESCEYCPSGTFLDHGLCKDCPPGTFSLGVTCENCPRGRYSNKTAQAECKDCAFGKITSSPRQTDSAACIECKNTEEVISGFCVQCAPGKGMQTPHVCVSCGVGEYGLDGLCRDCPGDMYSLAGSFQCKLCPIGKTKQGDECTTSGKCEAGKFGTDCSECPVGKWSVANAEECTTCFKGRYNDQRAQISCKPCRLGYYNSEIGQVHCSQCPRGRYQMLPEQFVCNKCANGRYSNNVGTEKCLDCPAGKYTISEESESIHECLDCPLGYYESQRSCLPCVESEYQDQTGQTKCKGCPENFLSPRKSMARTDCFDISSVTSYVFGMQTDSKPEQFYDQTCEIRPNLVMICPGCTCNDDSRRGFWAGPICNECRRGFATSECTVKCPAYDGTHDSTMCNGNGRCWYGKYGDGVCYCGGNSELDPSASNIVVGVEICAKNKICNGYGPETVDKTEYIPLYYMMLYRQYSVFVLRLNKFAPQKGHMWFKRYAKAAIYENTCLACTGTYEKTPQTSIGFWSLGGDYELFLDKFQTKNGFHGENCQYECGLCINGHCLNVPHPYRHTYTLEDTFKPQVSVHLPTTRCICTKGSSFDPEQMCCPNGFQVYVHDGLRESTPYSRFTRAPYITDMVHSLKEYWINKDMNLEPEYRMPFSQPTSNSIMLSNRNNVYSDTAMSVNNNMAELLYNVDAGPYNNHIFYGVPRDICRACPGLFGKGVRSRDELIKTEKDAEIFWWDAAAAAGSKKCNGVGVCDFYTKKQEEIVNFMGDADSKTRKIYKRGRQCNFIPKTAVVKSGSLGTCLQYAMDNNAKYFAYVSSYYGGTSDLFGDESESEQDAISRSDIGIASRMVNNVRKFYPILSILPVPNSDSPYLVQMTTEFNCKIFEKCDTYLTRPGWDIYTTDVGYGLDRLAESTFDRFDTCFTYTLNNNKEKFGLYVTQEYSQGQDPFLGGLCPVGHYCSMYSGIGYKEACPVGYYQELQGVTRTITSVRCSTIRKLRDGCENNDINGNCACKPNEATFRSDDFVDNVCKRCPRDKYAPIGSYKCYECGMGSVKKLSGFVANTNGNHELPTMLNIPSIIPWYYMKNEFGLQVTDCARMPASFIHIPPLNEQMSYERPNFIPVISCPFGYSGRPGQFVYDGYEDLNDLVKSSYKDSIKPPYIKFEPTYLFRKSPLCENSEESDACDGAGNGYDSIEKDQMYICRNALRELEGITHMVERKGGPYGCWFTEMTKKFGYGVFGSSGNRRKITGLTYICLEGKSNELLAQKLASEFCFKCPGNSITGPGSGACTTCFENKLKFFAKEAIQNFVDVSLPKLKKCTEPPCNENEIEILSSKAYNSEILNVNGAEISGKYPEKIDFMYTKEDGEFMKLSECYAACMNHVPIIAFGVRTIHTDQDVCGCITQDLVDLKPESLAADWKWYSAGKDLKFEKKTNSCVDPSLKIGRSLDNETSCLAECERNKNDCTAYSFVNNVGTMFKVAFDQLDTTLTTIVSDSSSNIPTNTIYKIRTFGKCTDENGWNYISTFLECRKAWKELYPQKKYHGTYMEQGIPPSCLLYLVPPTTDTLITNYNTVVFNSKTPAMLKELNEIIRPCTADISCICVGPKPIYNVALPIRKSYSLHKGQGICNTNAYNNTNAYKRIYDGETSITAKNPGRSPEEMTVRCAQGCLDNLKPSWNVYATPAPFNATGFMVETKRRFKRVYPLWNKEPALHLSEETNTGTPIGECQGHCQGSFECFGHLECYENNNKIGTPIPGCAGLVSDLGHNYCYDPYKFGYQLQNIELSPFYKLKDCEGNCIDDNDCEGNLVCFLRDTSRDTVPGCLVGGDGDIAQNNYCYNNIKHPSARVKNVVGKTVHLGACEGHCRSDSECTGTLKCWKRDALTLQHVSTDSLLNECQGDCDHHSECRGSLKCRLISNTSDSVTGCISDVNNPNHDYCYDESGSRKANNPVPGCRLDGLVESRSYCYDPTLFGPATYLGPGTIDERYVIGRIYTYEQSDSALAMDECKLHCMTTTDCVGFSFNDTKKGEGTRKQCVLSTSNEHSEPAPLSCDSDPNTWKRYSMSDRSFYSYQNCALNPNSKLQKQSRKRDWKNQESISCSQDYDTCKAYTSSMSPEGTVLGTGDTYLYSETCTFSPQGTENNIYQRVYESGPFSDCSLNMNSLEPPYSVTLPECRNKCLKETSCVSYSHSPNTCTLYTNRCWGEKSTSTSCTTMLFWNLLPEENAGRCTCVNDNEVPCTDGRVFGDGINNFQTPFFCQSDKGYKIGVFFGDDINSQAKQFILNDDSIVDETIYTCSQEGYNSCELYKDCAFVGSSNSQRTYYRKNISPGWNAFPFPLCSSCQPGKFTMDGDQSCHDCDSGQYTATQVQSSGFQCNPCPDGHYQPSMGGISCLQCPVGLYNDHNNVNKSFCLRCSPAKYQGETGQSTCHDCPDGYVANGYGNSKCEACAAGKKEVNDECTGCASGKYQSKTAQVECVDCGVGQHQDQVGQTGCKNCGGGRYSNQNGLPSCIKCLGGTHQDQVGQTGCKNCGSGKFSDTDGQASCKTCNSGNKRSRTCDRMGEHNECGSGHFLNAGVFASQCKSCPVDKTHDTYYKECVWCEAGKTTWGKSGSICTNCPHRGFDFGKTKSWLYTSSSKGFRFSGKEGWLSWPYYPLDKLPIIALAHCSADCDSSSDCQGPMVCHQQSKPTRVPGCRRPSSANVWMFPYLLGPKYKQLGNWDHCVYPTSYTSKYRAARINAAEAWITADNGKYYIIKASTSLKNGDLVVYYQNGQYTQLSSSRTYKRYTNIEKLRIECRSWTSTGSHPNYDGSCGVQIVGGTVWKSEPTVYCGAWYNL